MTDNATPAKKPRNYSRPTKYPAQLSVMVTAKQRATIDALVDETGATLGEVARALIDDGLLWSDVNAGTRADVRRLAREAGVTEAEAITTMLDYAVRKTERPKRDITIEL